ncbi:hypothetical protein N9948_01755 [bacterium]|nr:hypothetical protein [bacterium]
MKYLIMISFLFLVGCECGNTSPDGKPIRRATTNEGVTCIHMGYHPSRDLYDRSLCKESYGDKLAPICYSVYDASENTIVRDIDCKYYDQVEETSKIR